MGKLCFRVHIESSPIPSVIYLPLLCCLNLPLIQGCSPFCFPFLWQRGWFRSVLFGKLPLTWQSKSLCILPHVCILRERGVDARLCSACIEGIHKLMVLSVFHGSLGYNLELSYKKFKVFSWTLLYAKQLDNVFHFYFIIIMLFVSA